MLAERAPSTVAEADRRHLTRTALDRAGTLRIDGEVPLEIRVSDLTREGCRIQTDATLEPNQQVEVGLAHVGLTKGRIVWRGSAGYGCRFDRPLPAGAVTAAFGASNVTSLSGPGYRLEFTPPDELSPRSKLVVMAAGSAAGWGVVLLTGLLLLR